MAKKFLCVSAGLLMLSGAYSIVANNCPEIAISAEDHFGPIGRYQIFQGTYQYIDARDGGSLTINTIFRLDTSSGEIEGYTAGVSKEGKTRSFWVTCGGE